MKITVTLTNGTSHTVERFALADQIAFERRFDRSVQALGADPRVEHLAFLCWHDLQRRGGYQGDFEAFIGEVDSFDLASEDGGPLGDATGSGSSEGEGQP